MRDPAVMRDWRRLQTSDHFYYMCTKWFADGDVHKYFNPYDSPYESFITFMNIYRDLQMRCNIKNKKVENTLGRTQRKQGQLVRPLSN